MKTIRKPAKILIISLVIILLLLLFIISPRIFSGADTSRLMGVKFAHRGYFDNDNGIPENSLLSFEKAIEKGYGIELDVQLSSDCGRRNAPLERCTGGLF